MARYFVTTANAVLTGTALLLACAQTTASAQPPEEPVIIVRTIPDQVRDGAVIVPGYEEQITIFADGRRETKRLPPKTELLRARPSLSDTQPAARGGLIGGGLSVRQPAGLQNRGLTAPVNELSTQLQPPQRAVLGSDAVWSEPVIPVCWEDINAPADGRAWTQDAVEKSWATVTNLSFTGWNACTPSSSGIRIKVAEAGPRVEELGRAIDGMENGMTLNFSFNSWGRGCGENREYCIRALAVHEFGHAIGLAHEHNRDDRALCRAEKQGPLPAYTMTQYDPTSVMNYCAKDWINRGELSELDVTGARLVYGPFTDQTPAVARYRMDVSFMRTDGTAARPAPVEFDLKVTERAPISTETRWLCSDDGRLLELTAKATLVAGKPQIDVSTAARLFKAEDCQPGGTLIGTGSVNQRLFEPLPAGLSQPMTFPGANASMGETKIVTAPYRVVGPENLGTGGCTDCAAAAQEAVFAAAPDPDFRIEPIVFQPRVIQRPTSEWVEAPLAFSVIRSDAVWSDPTIAVCWETMSAGDADGRAWTRAAVENTWEKVSSVDFVGWQRCAADSYGIRIEVSDSAPHVDKLGRGIDGQPGGMTLNFSFQNWGQGCQNGLQYCISTLAVHEFGHALGLAHEHNRDDRTACNKEPQGPMPDFVLTAYDETSVMNYCSDQWINDGHLSELDVLGIRQVYGPFTEDAPMRVDLAGYASFSPAGGGAPINKEWNETLYLTEAGGDQSFTANFCDGDEFLIQINGTARIGGDPAKGQIATRSRVFQTSDCQAGGAVLLDRPDNLILTDPGQSIASAGTTIMERADDEIGRTISFNISPTRVIGEEIADAGSCQSCAAAAEEARFASEDAPVSFAGVNLYRASVATVGIASPWPDDFNLNLKVCADAARAVPYGNRDWSEDDISRLCDASPTSQEPAKCFATLMEGQTSWGGGTTWNPDNARNLCASSRDGAGTVRCFSRQISAGTTWPQAIDACAVN